MGMRITTGMAMNTYRYNLQNSISNLDKSRNKVQTHRKFDSFAEDPSAAIQAWRVRRSIVNNDIFSRNNKDTYTRFSIAEATMKSVSRDLTDLGGRKSDIYAANDPTATGRTELGKVLSDTAESVIHDMNGAVSGENFVFAGDDELNAPFSWKDGQLYFRGVNVNAGMVKSPAEVPDWAPEQIVKDADGKDVNVGADNTDVNALADAFVKSLPKETDDMNEALWADYYRGKASVEMPDASNPDTIPSWVPMVEKQDPAYPTDPTKKIKVPAENTDKDAMAQAFKDQLPQTGETKAEQAWIDYYKDTTGALRKPSDNPKAMWGAQDDFGVPNVAYTEKDNAATTAYNRAWAEYFIDQGDAVKLDRMAAEEVPIDLGMGMLEESEGKLVPGTYFSRALSGLNMLGYGVDEDGDPKNVCMIMKELGAIYSRTNPNTGAYASDEDYEDAMRLMNKLKAGQAYTTGQSVDIDARAQFLKQNQERLDLQGAYLGEQRAELEDENLALSIENFSWDYYCYSAALKVGTQLLSQSLIDYMT